MQYRKFGKLNWEVSALGFGCMRLPTTDGLPQSSNIDNPEAAKMLRYAIDNGVNYIDTAFPYHAGNSETFVGKVLKDGYRDKVKIVTKLPPDRIVTADDFDKILNTQLKKLQTPHIDFYLLHALNQEKWRKLYNMGVLSWAEGAIADGRIGYLGFSFHDTFSVFKEIIDSFDKWTLCLIQYNYLNEHFQAATEGLKYAADRGMAVAIMEPLLGGKLANPPALIKEIWEKTGKNPVDMALKWLWQKPEVSVVLSGMSTMEQVKQNIESAEISGIGSFSKEEFGLIAKIQQQYKELTSIPCTKCGYCMPCPNGIDIPQNLELYNQAIVHSGNGLAQSRTLYNNFLSKEKQAASCIGCRVCEAKCPQDIKISEWMPIIHQKLTEK